MAAAEPSRPRQRPGPRTLEEEYAELGEAAPWVIDLHRACDLYERRRLKWQIIARHQIGVSVSQLNRWRRAYAGLRAAGRLTRASEQ